MISKTIVSVVMWLVLGSISVVALSDSMFLADWAVVALTLVPIILAMAGTAVIWAPETKTEPKRVDVQPEKAKRQTGDDRVRMLLELMDTHEREAFKQQLKRQLLNDDGYNDMGSDGELPVNLASLLEEDDDKLARR